MSAGQNPKPLEQRLHEASARAEQEVRKLVRYLDDEVVPEVRRNGSTALRAAAVRLQRLAESMEDARSDKSAASHSSNAEGNR